MSTEHPSGSIMTEARGRVLVVTLNRPAVRNALDGAACVELSAVWDRFEADDDLWVAIVTGTGDRAFCAGHDLASSDAMPATGWAGLSARVTPLSKPVIAAVNGDAFGGGFELAIACDLVVADEAARFAMSEPRVGHVALGGGPDRLVRRIPTAVAMSLLLTGRSIDAAEAHRWGIVSDVAPAGRSVEVAHRWAEQILECSPLAVRYTKELALASLEGPAFTQTNAERRQAIFEEVLALQDTREGVSAFLEKRRPTWRGR